MTAFFVGDLLTWEYGISARIIFFSSRGVNMVCMRGYGLWSIPYGYGMEVWVVVLCLRLVLQPKEKFILLTSEVVGEFENSTSLQKWYE